MISPLNYVKFGGILAVVVTIGILAYQNKSLRSDKKSLETSLSTVLAANDEQSKTIMGLRKQAVLDAEKVLKLQIDLKEIAAHDFVSREKLKKLEQSNNEIHQYLQTPVPNAIVELLDNQSSD